MVDTIIDLFIFIHADHFIFVIMDRDYATNRLIFIEILIYTLLRMSYTCIGVFVIINIHFRNIKLNMEKNYIYVLTFYI